VIAVSRYDKNSPRWYRDHVAKKRTWVRWVILVIALTNLIVLSAGMIWGIKRWPFIASGSCWLAWGVIHYFFEADLVSDPAPTTTRILDI
jgi:hypothetical protein